MPSIATDSAQSRREVKIAVLMGGPSGEHHISLQSGRGVLEALRGRGWAAQPLVIPRGLSGSDASQWTRGALQQCGAGVVWIALHGPFGEDGTVQRLCDELGLAFTGSDADASRIGMDKRLARQRFIEAGLQVPRWRAVRADRVSPGALADLRYPLVVKPAAQGSSLGVTLVRTAGGLDVAIHCAGRFGSTVLIEEYVRGRELTISVLGHSALPVVEIVPRHAFFDFEAKYTPGMTTYRVPAPVASEITAQVQAVGLLAHQAIGARHVSRTDLILDEHGVPRVLEVNTIPGFTPTSLLPKAAAAAGISYAQLCEDLAVMALEDAPVFGRSEAATGRQV